MLGMHASMMVWVHQKTAVNGGSGAHNLQMWAGLW